jgi:hypothetical protein
VPDELDQMRWRLDRSAKAANTMLARWSGSIVRVNELTVSLRTLSIVLMRDWTSTGRQNLVVSAGPLWMRGPFEWEDALLLIEVVDASETPAARFTRSPYLFKLHDPIGFESFSEDIHASENVRLY